jgi:deoxyribonuclease V
MVWGTAIVLELPSLRVRDIAIAARKEEFPYIPGLLSFREAPAILQALESLSTAPDILLCDGQGIAHPRRLGIASHLGVLTGLPSIGCAKSLLCGHLEGKLEAHVGSTAPVWDRGEVIAVALRTRANVKPVYVSIGHRVDMAFAVEFVLQCCRGYRLPEPVRLADAVSRRAARGESVERLLLKTRTAS